MLKKFTITVVIPTFNRENTITYCLKSVLAQTYSPTEIIIVDDCSSDKTVEIVNSFSDYRIRCIVLDKNSGAQVARNRGIKEAEGEWIAFHDSDDTWLPDKLEKQVNALKKVNFNPYTVVHTQAIWWDEKNKKELGRFVPTVEGENVLPLLLEKPGPVFPTLLTSKEALEKIGFLDEDVPSYQEWDTSIRLAQYCQFIFIEEPLFVYYLHTGDTISKNKTRDVLGYSYIVNKFKHRMDEACYLNHIEVLLNKCLKFKLWDMAKVYFDILKLCNIKKINFYRVCLFTRSSPEELNKIINNLKNPLRIFKNKMSVILSAKGNKR